MCLTFIAFVVFVCVAVAGIGKHLFIVVGEPEKCSHFHKLIVPRLLHRFE